MYCIARPKNGISLNGDEYACYPGKTEKALFKTPSEAELALLYYGYDKARAEAEGIYIKEMPDESGENGDNGDN